MVGYSRSSEVLDVHVASVMIVLKSLRCGFRQYLPSAPLPSYPAIWLWTIETLEPSMRASTPAGTAYGA
jgi:hypothetical protein